MGNASLVLRPRSTEAASSRSLGTANYAGRAAKEEQVPLVLSDTIMTMSWKVGTWLGVLGLAWLTPTAAHAGDLIPGLKIDAGVNAWFKIYTPQKMAMKNLAPWYTYFPYDPAMMGPPPGNRYPTWPSPYPPPQPTTMTPQAANGQRPLSAPPRSPQGPVSGQVAGAWQAPPVQPVSYLHTPVPSYWFAR